MNLTSHLLGFMLSPAQWIPTIIVFVAAFILLKKAGATKQQLVVYVGAIVVGIMFAPIVREARIDMLTTYMAGNTLYVYSFLWMLSANVAPVVLLVLALKVRSISAEKSVGNFG